MSENNGGVPGGGWIKLYRAVVEKGWLTNHKLWAFLCYCLLKATHKAVVAIIGSQQIPLQPGEFVFGRKRAMNDLEMTEKCVRTCVETLVRLGTIKAIKRASKYTVFSVVNWDIYQGQPDEEGQQTGRQEGEHEGNRGASKGPHTRSKEVKKERNKDIAPSPEVRAAIDYFFQSVEKAKGFRPRISSKDAALVKANLKNSSLDRIKAQIDFFLGNGKAREHLTLSAGTIGRHL